MSITRNSFRRPAALFAAAALLVGTALPALTAQQAFAAGQVTERIVQMSDSAPSGGTITSGVGSGTAVSYAVSFKAITNTAVGGIVVDICDNTPLIGDTSCTFPTGFSWGGATPTLSGGTVTNITGTWTASSAQGGGPGAGSPQVLFLSNSSPAAPTAMGTAITFTITGITNPSAAITPSSSHSFYARILTFDTSAHMTGQYTTTGTTRAATFTNNIDNGGAAMSLTLPIVVTARVMETLSLCAAKATYTGVACAGPTGTDTPSVILGNGGSTNVLDTASVYTSNIYTQISTNATNGYALYLRAGNDCASDGSPYPGGLSKDGGAHCQIPAVNAGGATSAAIVAGTAAFGATVSDGTAVGGGTGTNTAVARWKASPSYIMDSTTSNDNVGYTYGSKIASSTGQANGVNNTITFAATASPTTPAGIYTENFSLIGVGTF